MNIDVSTLLGVADVDRMGLDSSAFAKIGMADYTLQHRKAALETKQTYCHSTRTLTCLLLSALRPVIQFAKKLTVFQDGLATRVPRQDVVRFHFLKGVMLDTHRTYAFLTFVFRGSDFIIESSEVKCLLIAAEKVFIDASLVIHLIVRNEFNYLLLKPCRVQCVVFVPIVKATPWATFHKIAVVGKNTLDPVDNGLKILPKITGICIQLMKTHILFDLAFGDPIQGRL